MSRALHRLLLACAATDSTFTVQQIGGEQLLCGKCIHCNTRLTLGLDGRPRSHATLEHILPQHHGGTDELDNLAIACARCNQQKGRRHDCQRADDPTLLAVVTTLRARKAQRHRAPLEQLGPLLPQQGTGAKR